MNLGYERIKMSGKRISTILVLSVLVIFMAGCALPYITPPAEYSATEPPTITPPVPGTAIPATATVQPIAREITVENAASLAAVSIVPASNVQIIKWSEDGNYLGLVTQTIDAAGNSVYTALVLDGKSLAVKTLSPQTEGRISDISFYNDNYFFVAVIPTKNDTVREIQFEIDSGNWKDESEITPGFSINTVTYSPDGFNMAISSNDSWLVKIIPLIGGGEQTLTGFETAAPIYSAGYKGSNDVIAWHARATIQTQSVSTGKMGIATSSEDFVDQYALSPDGKLLASAAMKTIDGNYTSTVTLWNASSGAEVRILILAQSVSCMAFSADGTMLAIGSGNDIQVYEVSSGNLLATLSGHSGLPMAVAFAPDGSSLVSAGQDNQLILWQVMK
jgi:WD40 repeat protein